MDVVSQSMDPSTVIAYEKEYVLHTWMAQKSFKPIVITRGEGCYFWDEQGKKYLDFAAQLINVNAGHQHPKIVQAIKDQAERLCYVVPSVANEQRAKLAKMLAEIAPGDLNKSFLVTGGGVANENALKIARAVTGRQKVIARFRSYHGGTYGASSVLGDPRRIASEPGVPGSLRVWDPLCYRCFFKWNTPHATCTAPKPSARSLRWKGQRRLLPLSSSRSLEATVGLCHPTVICNACARSATIMACC